MTASIDHINSHESPQERIPREVAERFESYLQNSTLQQLIVKVAEQRGVDIPDVTLGESEYMEATQSAFDFRNGKGRNEVKAADFDDETKDLLADIVDQFDMKRDTEPENPDFDVAFIPGAAGKVPSNRLAYLRELEEKGALNSPTVVLIGCERPVDMKQNPATGQNELDRAGPAANDKSGHPAEIEFDIMRNTAAELYDIADDEWELFEGDDKTVPQGQGFQSTYKIARVYRNGQQILVTSAPMLDEDRYYPDGNPRTRANTVDGFEMMAEIMGMGDGKLMRAAVVTDSVFRFQHVEAEKALAPYGVEVETVGFTREHVGMTTDWPGGETYYINEILSELRQTRAARNRLMEIDVAA